MFIVSVTSFVVIFEGDNVDSELAVDVNVVIDVECVSVGEDIIVDVSWLISGSSVMVVILVVVSALGP